MRKTGPPAESAGCSGDGSGPGGLPVRGGLWPGVGAGCVVRLLAACAAKSIGGCLFCRSLLCRMGLSGLWHLCRRYPSGLYGGPAGRRHGLGMDRRPAFETSVWAVLACCLANFGMDFPAFSENLQEIYKILQIPIGRTEKMGYNNTTLLWAGTARIGRCDPWQTKKPSSWCFAKAAF